MILRVIPRIRKPPAEKRKRNRGTCFGICLCVREIIRNGKPLSIPPGPRAARYIQFSAHNVVKQDTASFEQTCVTRQPPDIRHSNIKIERTYYMPLRLTLFPDGHMRLIICPVRQWIYFFFTNTAFIKKKLCKPQIPIFSRILKQSDKSELDFRMSACCKTRIPQNIKSFINVVCIFFHSRKQFVVDAVLIKRYSGFNQMPCTV